MESQIDVVLKFSDDRTVWICPECDMENSMMSGICDVCGCVRQSNADVVSLYEAPTPVSAVEINNASATPYTGTLSDRTDYRSTPRPIYGAGGAPRSGERPYTPPKEKGSSSGWIWAVIAFIIILGIIGAATGEF